MSVTGKRQRLAGRYLLESEIGSGGMGVVWRARDERLGRDVALKLLAANAVGNDVARARLLREARAAGRLQHEGIVHVYDVGETPDGGAFLVMELVAGHPLRAWMDDGRLSLKERIELVLGIAGALQCAHELGVVHRDVKPENVLVRTSGRPVLLDFGLAKPVASPLVETLAKTDSLRLTGTGNIVGTPAYLAPEQVKGEAVGAPADQFSLAVMTFELLTGQLPWRGNTVIEVIASMLHDAPVNVEELAPELPAGTGLVLQRAMHKQASERFPSVAAFAEALRAFFPEVTTSRISSLPPPAIKPRIPTPNPSRVSPSAETSLARKTSIRPGSRPVHRLLRATALLGLVGVLALASALITQRLRKSASATSVGSPATTPLVTQRSVVACPLFEVSGDFSEASTGWVAAASAALTCDRIQALLGGAPESTLAPAELVPGLPREPSDTAPSEPFEGAGLAEKTLVAARERAPVHVVGSIHKTAQDFSIEITLRTAKGQELGRGQGRGEELFEAVSSAVRQAKKTFGEGSASEFQKQWLRVTTTEAALDVLDVTTALLAEADQGTRRACERAEQQASLLPEMKFLLRAVCHERLQRAPLPDSPPAIDTTSIGALVTTVAAQRTRGGREETQKRVELLRNAQASAKTANERAILLVTIAELLYNVGDLQGAQSAARMAGQLAPKLVDPRGTPWHRLTFAADFDRAISRVHVAWLPWQPTAVMNSASREANLLERAKLAARAYTLCRKGYYAAAYGEVLAIRGRPEEARNIADQLDDDYLRVRAYLSATQYKRGLELATHGLSALPAQSVNAGKAFRLAAAGAEAARYLGRPAVFVEDLVARFIEAEPPHIRVGVMPFFSLVYACLEAPKPVAHRCMARLRHVYQRGDLGGVLGVVPMVLEGADHWIAGDATRAARAWRPMLRQGGNIGEAPFRHILATALDRAQMSDVAERADAHFVQLLELPDAIDLSFARSALRAEKAGDLPRARQLAEACVERWQHADDDIPARKEMQRLLDRLTIKH